ncbi:putative ABC transporter permease [Arabiibacter massiliensis]|uniref:putative ABC transporter permease n=1 Tax=Arabiibacter massiliensis TaxID=1870985 RepID=UPI0009BA46E9|nr:putative ABC transporter permease [Arabiibacter massiliensis]
MPLLTKDDELVGYAPDAFAFWRNLAVYFCAFSVIGHWMEIAYCSSMNLFGIVDADSLVWDDPMYPFLVYGVGVAVCVLLLEPLKQRLVARRRTLLGAGAQFYLITVGVCLVMELGMGLMLNQPNAAGEYPLWDNSQLPLNVLGQAWLVNDLALGAVAMLYTWVVYPLSQKALAKLPLRVMNALAAAVVVGFTVLCAVKFA